MKKPTKKGRVNPEAVKKKTTTGKKKAMSPVRPDILTRFKPGNEFWKARSTHGANPKFIKETLLDACVEYFQWVEDNPLLEEKVFHTAGIITRAQVAHVRAMTIGGLCLFLDISEDTWGNYRKTPDLLGITNNVDRAIRNQKFEGAAADLLNPNIIARDLGLVDKKEVEDTTKPTRTADELEKMRKITRAIAEGLK